METTTINHHAIRSDIYHVCLQTRTIKQVKLIGIEVPLFTDLPTVMYNTQWLNGSPLRDKSNAFFATAKEAGENLQSLIDNETTP